MYQNKILRKLYPKLPEPFTIAADKIRLSYQTLYSKILDAYKKNDFFKINSLLNETLSHSKIVSFRYQPTDNNSTKDTFLVDFVNLIYSIITAYPVKYYRMPITAATFLNEFLYTHKNIQGLKLDWYPYFKVMKYFTLSAESYFNKGSYLKKTNPFGKFGESSVFLDLSLMINKYFPDEIEVSIDGKTVKTNTTEQLLKKFLHKISPNGHYTPAYLTYLSILMPPHRGRYKKYIDFLLCELHDTTDFTCSNVILGMLFDIVRTNIEDDFSFLVPIVSQMISCKIINIKQSDYQNFNIVQHLSFDMTQNDLLHLLPEIVIALFISPPTRKSILELLESIFISFESKCHPSDTNINSLFIVIFSELLVMSLKLFLRKLEKKKEGKIYFNMEKEKGPSEDEMHKFLSMTSEMKIMNIRMCFNPESVMIETVLDRSTIDHYFKIGFQCINLMDAYDVSNSGWTILSALVMSIEKNKTVCDNFQTIFEIATNNMYREELQMQIANFLAISVAKVPFNKENTLKGCEHINFPKLASSFFSNLMTILRSLPSVNGETSSMEREVSDLFGFIATTIYQHCDTEVMNEILPIFTSLCCDEDIAHSVYNICNIITNYCYFAKYEQVDKIAKAFKKQLQSPNLNFNMFRFLAIIYSRVLISNLKSIECARETTQFLLQFTKSEDEKIRKIAWESISKCLGCTNQLYDLDITLKPEKMKDNPLENADLDDFDIKWKMNDDFSNLALEIFDPLFDKLLTLNDSHKINDLLNDSCDAISYVLQTIYQYTEGSIENVVSDTFIDSIHVLPDIYKKSIPIKDKFIKCALRIIKDFPENENVISQIVSTCLVLFQSYINVNESLSENALNLVFSYFVPFKDSESYYNSAYLYSALSANLLQRKKLFIIPVTDDIKQLLKNIVELGSSKYQSIQKSCSAILDVVSTYYYPLIESAIQEKISKSSSIPINEFIIFLNTCQAQNFLKQNNKLLCQVLIIILNNLVLTDKEKLDDLKDFIYSISILMVSHGTPHSNEEEFVNLLNKIEKNYLNKNQANRTYNNILMHIIFLCLKRVYDISDKILEYIMNNVTHFDSDISKIAEVCLTTILERRAKFTKEKIEVKEFPTIATIPNVFEQVCVKYKDNGIYFPSELKVASNEEANDEDDNEIEQQYSLELDPTNSFDTMPTIEENEDVKKVFESFKHIDIEWLNYEQNKIFDSEFLFDPSNGFFEYKKSFNHKKYEFKEDKFLIKNISNIFASASYSINEKNLKAAVKYRNIWEKYSLLVGPFCIKELHKNSLKFLSQYYSFNPIVVTKILTDMISGFMIKICYWSLQDRIRFFKLVALPVICIICSNPNTSKFAKLIIERHSYSTNPFCIAPVLKVLYDLSPSGPNLPLYNRSLVSILSKQVFMKPFHFFNSIDQFNSKFVLPFISRMSEYNSNEVEEIISFIFGFLEISTFSNKNSPIYSNELENKKKQILVDLVEKIFQNNEKIINNDNFKRIMIRSLTSSFVCFSKSTYDLRFLMNPIFVTHLHEIFTLLNTSNIKDEDNFIDSTNLFIGDRIFFSNNKMELDFVSAFIKESMNLSLPMQLIMLENLNSMLEGNIFNIPSNDFAKYEETLLDYGNYAKSKKLGNELRLKIAKILGIFEIRKCNLNTKISNDDDQKMIDNEILKAASIILNSFLFDKADQKVTNAFNLMEEYCSSKSSKNKDFFKSVSEIFIYRHSEHVLNEVEDLIIQYKGMLTPSYIC